MPDDCLNPRMDAVEQEVIRRVLSGDRDAYRVLMERHLPAVLRVTMRITASEVDAEEAAQEAFLRAYNKLPEFRGQSSFGTWVYRIAMNCSLNIVERRSRDLSWNAVEISGDVSGANQVQSKSATPERTLLDGESQMLRERAMRQLTPMERTAFVLRHMEDQPMNTIAAALGVPVNSAKQAVFRAVSKLRKELRPAKRLTPIARSMATTVKEVQG
jgi:RNA polymerase sigma-70 factor (ECF subfamily)